jgi:hypothetical protein
MEAPRARSDATQTLDLSKDSKASESATQYKRPTVEEYVSDDNEHQVARPYGIESPGMSALATAYPCMFELVSSDADAYRARVNHFKELG